MNFRLLLIILHCMVITALIAQKKVSDTTFYPNTKLVKSIVITKGGTKHTFTYADNGQLMQESTHVNELLQGEWKSWFRSGKLSKICTYEKGLLKGSCKTYYEDGTLNDETT